MRISMGLSAAAAILALVGARPAAASDWPHVLPALPLVQANRVCAPGLYLNRRCHVIDFAHLGRTKDGRDWYYSFEDTHWADRHGRMDRGFPLIFYLQHPATLRLSLRVNDEPGLNGHWAVTAPTRPMLMKRPDAAYIGFTLKSVEGPDDQRLFRQNKLFWKEIDILHRSSADQDRLGAAMPPGCEAADDGFYAWDLFSLVLALRQRLTHAPCGYLTAPLAVKGTKLTLKSVSYHKPEQKPPAAEPADSASPHLTSKAGAPNSTSR
jgi:hypothetical protein